MKALRNYLDKIKPNFEEGGKLAMFRSVFDGFETFLFVPNETSKTGVHIHDCIDSKRAMTVVIIALLPALLFGLLTVLLSFLYAFKVNQYFALLRGSGISTFLQPNAICFLTQYVPNRFWHILPLISANFMRKK